MKGIYKTLTLQRKKEKFPKLNGQIVSLQEKKEINNLLINAVREKDIGKVKQALKIGASPNAEDERCRNTALMIACWKEGGSLEIVKLLLEHGADPNGSNMYGSTALMWAVREGNLEIVKRLHQNGAYISLESVCGDGAIDFAIRHGWPKIRDYFMKEFRKLERP